ncbi:DUF4864 domain-containing protein [Corticibacterium sp. UT-5YL-CI-8]|nr:DUF4864 domain-containing protein [Tianweitania sp. UT-5YL-CI-8]
MSTRLFVLLLLLFPFGASAGDAEVKAAQSIIESQLGAFASGDNAGAYGYAAPGVKQVFPTLEAFMGMVTGPYRPVYQPRDYSFGKVEEMVTGEVVQQLLLTGEDGKNYEAVYVLERQPDGSWRIKGVSLKASNALTI